MMQGLSIFLLGPPRIERDDAALSFDTRKAVALLAYLATTRHSHSREALADLLWPEYPDPRNALRRTLSVLQRSLGEGWLDVERDHVAIVSRPDLRVDVAAFEAGLSNSADSNAITAAVALYRDDFLAGFTLRDSSTFDEWQFFETERLRQLFATALDRLAELHGSAGDYDAAIGAARRRLALDLLHEPAHRTLMRLYAAAGQRSAALRQYRECARVLERELGVAPLDETVQLYEAIRTAPSAAPAREVPVAATPSVSASTPIGDPLIGRADERARLLATYAAAATGALAVIEGQPGIGKTRLADDLLAAARVAGAPTLFARCYEGEANLAYAPVAALLREAVAMLDRAGRLAALPTDHLLEAARLVPTLAQRAGLPEPPPLAGPDARRRFFEAVIDLLLAACGAAAPGVLLLDDAHWADGASLDLLTFLARRLRGRPAMLLLTWRSADVPADHPLRALVGEMRRTGNTCLIALDGLPIAAVADLARASGAILSEPLLQRLHHESEGVPFFVVEYLAALREGSLGDSSAPWSLPGGARDLLQARLRPLSTPARNLLTTAASIGRSFDFTTLRAAATTAEDEMVEALEELTDRGLIAETSSAPLRYDFSHEKLRALVYETTSQARRRLLHRRVAEHLVAQQDRAPAPGGPALIAYHYEQADETAAAADYHRQAGDQARALYANAEALTHYTAALALGHPDAAALHEAIGDLLALAGDYGAALDRYTTARQSGAPTHVERKLGEVNHRLGAWDAAEAHFASALAANNTDAAERALVYATWSLTARRRGDLERATSFAAESLALATTASDPLALARAHSANGALASLHSDHATAINHLEQSLILATQLDDPEARIAALNSLALALAAAGNHPRATDLATQALALCLARDDRHRAAALHNTLADLYHAVGEPEAARSHLREAVALFAAIGHDQPEIWMLTEW